MRPRGSGEALKGWNPAITDPSPALAVCRAGHEGETLLFERLQTSGFQRANLGGQTEDERERTEQYRKGKVG
jgi:hypothetical protein